MCCTDGHANTQVTDAAKTNLLRLHGTLIKNKLKRKMDKQRNLNVLPNTLWDYYRSYQGWVLRVK